MKKFELFNNKYLGVLIELNRLCIINVNIIRIIYNLLIKNIIDMSVDTVNTIVDITTLAQVQNELTMLDAPAAVKGMVSCTADAMTGCKDDNSTCSAACTAPTVVTINPIAADATLATTAVVAAWALQVTAKKNMMCIPAAGGLVSIPAVGVAPATTEAWPATAWPAYTVNCQAGATFLKAVSSIVAATMVMHLA